MRKSRFVALLLLLTCGLFQAGLSQQTLGLFENDTAAYNGYTIFHPMGTTETWMIDNCGRYVHSWPSATLPGLSVYLLENGQLLRPQLVPSVWFQGGGIGGRIELVDWQGNTVWQYLHANAFHHQHHDIEYLPNGNILILAWEMHSATEAFDRGREPNSLQNDIWPEQIIEIEPYGTDSANIVWEWHLWDHLIQDFDSTKLNYGVVADHPELLDINASIQAASGNPADWIHANSIDYNEELDQIMISSRNLHEILVVDHSTTTAEAAGHTGGNSGKGGDLLYRWGNPQNYDRGDSSDQVLFGQHDAHWIEEKKPGEGMIMVLNNGTGRPGGSRSSVDVWAAPMDPAGNYVIAAGQPFGPTALNWTYDPPVGQFYASFISGASRLRNGNTLITEGPGGRLFDIDSAGTIVWDYINPVNHNGPQTQGTTINGNNIFRAYKYRPEYSGFW
ncbi:MAG: aryl-sulfate sulfotransferase, partial [Bacteroidota bacterium]